MPDQSEEIFRDDILSDAISFELIGCVPALIARGVKITDGTWEYIKQYFGYMHDTSELYRPRLFDYVHLATDELAPDPNDLGYLDMIIEHEYGSGKSPKSLFDNFIPKSLKRYKDRMGTRRLLKKIWEINLKTGIESPYVSRDSQANYLRTTFARLSSDPRDPNLLAAIRTICLNPGLPFLIVSGHGSYQSCQGELTPTIGEKYGGVQTSLGQVFMHMGVLEHKYSLIVIERCNFEKYLPKKEEVGGTPIVQVLGRAIGINDKQSQCCYIDYD